MATKTRAAPESTQNDATSKPIASTLMQEFQNLKDKFKSDDDNADKGFALKISLTLYLPK